MRDDARRLEQLRRRVQLNPASIAFATLAEEYRLAGRHEEAIATCQAGLPRHPVYLSPRVTLGRALAALGRLEEARAELEHVLQAAPGHLAARQALADLEAAEVRALAPSRRSHYPVAHTDPRGVPRGAVLRELEAMLAGVERLRKAPSGGPSRPDDR